MDVFSYDLPEERIAQRPVRPYDRAKLLVVPRENGPLTESTFSHFADFVNPGDLLVFNDTKVIPARFFGQFASGGGGVEVLILQELSNFQWLSIGRPLKRFKVGSRIIFTDRLHGEVTAKEGTERVVLQFICPKEGDDVKSAMAEAGVMPIPPYIRKGVGDKEDHADYQTFFAQREGSVAAPTASLHFTPELLKRISDKGAEIQFLTLHVGAASFLPLWHEHDEALRTPGAEYFRFSASLLSRCREIKKRGGRVIAVGTTMIRALESHALVGKETQDGEFLSTELFITPGFEFKVVDAMVTNFHQPRTTHLLLVEAFLGRPQLKAAYSYALDHSFRFLSYGDGMFVP